MGLLYALRRAVHGREYEKRLAADEIARVTARVSRIANDARNGRPEQAMSMASTLLIAVLARLIVKHGRYFGSYQKNGITGAAEEVSAALMGECARLIAGGRMDELPTGFDFADPLVRPLESIGTA